MVSLMSGRAGVFRKIKGIGCIAVGGLVGHRAVVRAAARLEQENIFAVSLPQQEAFPQRYLLIQ